MTSSGNSTTSPRKKSTDLDHRPLLLDTASDVQRYYYQQQLKDGERKKSSSSSGSNGNNSYKKGKESAKVIHRIYYNFIYMY